jgi:hypothetical protein
MRMPDAHRVTKQPARRPQIEKYADIINSHRSKKCDFGLHEQDDRAPAYCSYYNLDKKNAARECKLTEMDGPQLDQQQAKIDTRCHIGDERAGKQHFQSKNHDPPPQSWMHHSQYTICRLLNPWALSPMDISLAK